ncbi:hypothetical protein FRB94_001985 [Tulasnella sp. JGI-2019a]|nr:hypothetical protein FRB94_001985 [Tulasnella sp. JGI-2019a]
MAAQLRTPLLARRLASQQKCPAARSFVTTRQALADAPIIVDAATVRPKKPIGGFRGGIFGFLLGFSVASAYASYRLLEEYKIASALLQASVEDLQASTDKVCLLYNPGFVLHTQELITLPDAVP